MITRTATLLSLAGILVAGSAAAVVNSQVLQESGDATGGQAPILAATTSTSVPASTATAVPVTQSSLPGSDTTTSSYAVGDAGVVTLDSTGGVLTLVSVVPNPGWVVDSTGINGFGGVRVTFTSSTVEVHFNAILVDGRVVTSVDAETIGDVTAPPQATGTSLDGVTGTTIDDHHDDDRDDDHDRSDDSGHSDDSDHADDNSGHGGGGDDD